MAHKAARGVRITKNSRDETEIDIPTPAEVRALIEAAGDDLRAFVLMAALAGLRASELRGLMWPDIDLAKGTVKIARRADDRNVLGPPKSRAGARTIPLSPRLLTELKAWKLRCAANDLDLVFPSPRGMIWTYKNLTDRAYFPLQVEAGLFTIEPDAEGGETKVAKYGLHALRHAAASLWIGQGIDLMRLKTWMGHAHVQTTIDTYGHLLHDHVGDAKLIAHAEKALFGNAKATQTQHRKRERRISAVS